LDLLLGVGVELLSFKLDWMMGLFLGFLDFRFLNNRLRFILSSWLLAFLLFIFLFILFCLFFLRGFDFLSPFFDQGTLFKGDQSIFCEFNLECNSESLMLRILSGCFVVSNVLVKSNNIGFILDQYFNGLSSLELDSLARWHFGSEIINHLTLSFRIFCRVKSEVVIIFDEIPVELYTIVNFFVQCVFLNSEERTLDGCLKSASSGNRFTRVQCSGRFGLEDFLDRLEEKWDSGSTSNQLDTMKLNVFCLKLLSNFSKDSLNFCKNRFCDFFELLSGHGVVEVIFLHNVLYAEVVLNVS